MEKGEMTTNWLCRMIGHKWTTRRRMSVDKLSWAGAIVWPNCLRCGVEAPDGLLMAYNGDADGLDTDETPFPDGKTDTTTPPRKPNQ